MFLLNKKQSVPPIIDIDKQGSIACHFNNITAMADPVPKYSVKKTKAY